MKKVKSLDNSEFRKNLCAYIEQYENDSVDLNMIGKRKEDDFIFGNNRLQRDNKNEEEIELMEGKRTHLFNFFYIFLIHLFFILN